MTIVHDGLAIFRFGAGKPLLFMPYPHAVNVAGDATPSALVDGVVDLGRQVITFDPPGAGRSTRPMRLTMQEMLDCTEEALTVCGIDGPVELLGHSQGGVAAVAFSLEHPERVSRLILVCTASGAPAYFRAPGAIWNRSHPDHRPMTFRAALYWLTRRRAAETMMLNEIIRASWVDHSRFQPKPISLQDWLRPARPRTWWGQMVRRLDYSGQLKEIGVPTLVLSGRHDPQMPVACAEELASGIPNAHLVIFEQSGHYPFMEESAALWEAVRWFLDAGEEGLSDTAADGGEIGDTIAGQRKG